MPNELYNNVCDILDTARDIAADTSTSIDQTLQAMKIAALLELRTQLASINDEVSALSAELELHR